MSVTQFNVEKTRARESNSVVERVDNLAQLCRGSRDCVVAKALPVSKTNVVTQKVWVDRRVFSDNSSKSAIEVTVFPKERFTSVCKRLMCCL